MPPEPDPDVVQLNERLEKLKKDMDAFKQDFIAKFGEAALKPT